MRRWWRSHSVRVQLTLWYVVAMVIVLGLLRDAGLCLRPPQRVGHARWPAARRFSVGCGDGRPDPRRRHHVVRGPDGGRKPVAAGVEPRGRPLVSELRSDSSPLAGHTGPGHARRGQSAGRLQTDIAPVRVLTRRGRIGGKPVVIQVARSEALMQGELRQLRVDLRARPSPCRGRGGSGRVHGGAPGAAAGGAHDRTRPIDHRGAAERSAPGRTSGRRDGPAGDGVQRDARRASRRHSTRCGGSQRTCRTNCARL